MKNKNNDAKKSQIRMKLKLINLYKIKFKGNEKSRTKCTDKLLFGKYQNRKIQTTTTMYLEIVELIKCVILTETKLRQMISVVHPP